MRLVSLAPRINQNGGEFSGMETVITPYPPEYNSGLNNRRIHAHLCTTLRQVNSLSCVNFTRSYLELNVLRCKVIA